MSFPQIPNTNGHNKHTFECIGCKKTLSLEMPRVEVVNTPKYSSAIATHERMQKCSNCGQAYFFYIKALRTSWDVQPISEEQRRQIEGKEIIQL